MPRSNMMRWLSAVLVMALMLGMVPTVPVVSAVEEPSQTKETLSTQSQQISHLDEDAVPDIVGLKEAENRGHIRRRQDEEGENLNTLIFENADGSRTMYLYDHPVKYWDSEGNLQDISLNIVSTGQRSVAYRSESSWVVTSFAADLSDGITLTGFFPVDGNMHHTQFRKLFQHFLFMGLQCQQSDFFHFLNHATVS